MLLFNLRLYIIYSHCEGQVDRREPLGNSDEKNSGGGAWRPAPPPESTPAVYIVQFGIFFLFSETTVTIDKGTVHEFMKTSRTISLSYRSDTRLLDKTPYIERHFA